MQSLRVWFGNDMCGVMKSILGVHGCSVCRIKNFMFGVYGFLVIIFCLAFQLHTFSKCLTLGWDVKLKHSHTFYNSLLITILLGVCNLTSYKQQICNILLY